MIEGLMHMGSMAVLGGTAYLGLEKVGSTKNAVSTTLDGLKADLNKELNRLNFKVTVAIDDREEELINAFNTLGGRFILELAGWKCPPLKGGWNKLWYKVYKAWYAPGLEYFRRGTHGVPVGFLTLLSIASFFFLVGTSVGAANAEDFHILVFHAPTTGKMIFDGTSVFEWSALIIFMLTLFVIFLNASMAHRFDHLRNSVFPKLDKVAKKQKAEYEQTVKAQQDLMNSAVGAVGDKHPPLEN